MKKKERRESKFNVDYLKVGSHYLMEFSTGGMQICSILGLLDGRIWGKDSNSSGTTDSWDLALHDMNVWLDTVPVSLKKISETKAQCLIGMWVSTVKEE